MSDLHAQLEAGLAGRVSSFAMRIPRLCIASVLLMLGAHSRTLAAQCRDADYDGKRFLELVRRHADASAARAAPRDSVRHGETRGTVALISSADRCAEAAAAYRRAANGDLSTLSDRVYVVRSGRDWFVWDPAYRFHSESPFVYMLFDDAWTLKRKFELD